MARAGFLRGDGVRFDVVVGHKSGVERGPDEVIARFERVVGAGRAIHEQDADLVADQDGLVEDVIARQPIPLNRHLHDALARLIETAGEHERVDLIRVDGIDLHRVLLDRLAVQYQVDTFSPLTVSWPVFLG